MTTTTDQTTPLSIEEAGAQLRDLDQLLYRRKITGIAYRNKKERLLARISKPADGPTHRYTTRRQVNALNPPQRKTFGGMIDQQQRQQTQPLQPISTRGPPLQQMRDELRDFIVYSTGDSDDSDSDDASEINHSEHSTHDIGREEEEEIIDIEVLPVQSVINTNDQPPAIHPDIDEQKARERREQEEHFKSVTVQFNRSLMETYKDDDDASRQRQPTGGLVTNYSPMFPPKQTKTVYIDFGTNKF